MAVKITALGNANPAPNPAPKWARPKQAAAHCGFSLSSFWNYARQCEDFPPLRRVGIRCTVVDLNQLDAWMAKGGAA